MFCWRCATWPSSPLALLSSGPRCFGGIQSGRGIFQGLLQLREMFDAVGKLSGGLRLIDLLRGVLGLLRGLLQLLRGLLRGRLRRLRAVLTQLLPGLLQVLLRLLQGLLGVLGAVQVLLRVCWACFWISCSF